VGWADRVGISGKEVELIVSRQMVDPGVSAQAAVNRCAAALPQGMRRPDMFATSGEVPYQEVVAASISSYLCVPSAAALLLPQSLDVTHVNQPSQPSLPIFAIMSEQANAPKARSAEPTRPRDENSLEPVVRTDLHF